MSKENTNSLKSILWIIVVLVIIVIGQNFYYNSKSNNTNNIVKSDLKENSSNKEKAKIEKIKVNDTKTEIKINDTKVEVKKNDTKVEGTKINNSAEVKNNNVKIIFISDKRCTAPECNVKLIVENVNKIPSLKNNKIKVLDYSDAEAKKIMKENGITKLPAGLFSSNDIDKDINQYLIKTKSNLYSLQLGASFDPTKKRSDKGFLILDKKVLEEIKANSYLKGEKNAKITWLEYSDLECPYCAKLHNSGTPEALEKKYGKDLNEYFQSFPLGFHKNAIPGANILECLAKEKGSKAYYDLKHIAFNQKNSNKDFLIDEAVKLGANKTTLEGCVDKKVFQEKINKQQEAGTKEFGVTGTPGNVLINNETGEYEVISGAYPTESFTAIIDKLLK